ncbi:MAG: efflux RND transporter periplasmic adaptor subunit [Rubrivivax sp.]|nr:MAG: efflux RND transporter periplasmic adaptor subunit [Rubrivivax sp.]
MTVLALLLLAGLVALAWWLTHREPEAPAAGGRPGGRGGQATTVGVAVARKADVPITVEALGTVTPAATVTVRPQVSGVLQQVLFKEGQLVSKGQLLATIDPRQFELTLMQATGQRQRDEAQLENARLTLQRYQTLLQQDSIARQDVDTQAALVRQLEGTATTNRANEGTARLNLGYSRIVAPIAGRVGLRVVDIGNVVSSGDANGIAVITQTAPIDVEFSLPQDRVPELQARMASGSVLPVTALDRTRSTVVGEGRFSTLDNQVDTQTGTVRAKARFANAKEALFPNQFVNVRLLLQTLEGAVTVPVAALRNSSKGEFVYVLDEAARTVATRPVKRGPATDEMVVIASGLQAGEKVITEGADRLKDGARVTLPGDAPASGAGGGRRRPDGAASGASGARSGRDGASAPHRRASEAAAP